MHTIVKGIAIGVIAMTLVACGSASGSVPDSPVGTPSVQPRWTSCAADAPPPSFGAGLDALALPRLGGDFAPTSVIVCDEQIQRRADGGQDLVATESRAYDISVLIAALRLPDERPTNGACTLDLPSVPWLALVDALGRWIHPGVPKDGCGKVRVEVRDAVAKLRQTRVATRVLRELESAQAAASGCGQTWSNMVAVETAQGSPVRAAVGSHPFPDADRIRLCVYRVPASEQDSDKPAGDFQHGTVLTPERRSQIEKALMASAPAGSCTTSASRFAVLSSEGSGYEVYVELDGCQRIMVRTVAGSPVLAHADASLVALLDRSL